MDKHYISPAQLLRDAFDLGWMVFQSGFRPDYVVGVWRGGAPVGIAVQELLHVLGINSDHIAIRAVSYTGIGERAQRVEVHGLDYLRERVKSPDSLLIVDDVHDTGLSIDQIVRDLRAICGRNAPEVRVATPLLQARQQPDRASAGLLHSRNRPVAGVSSRTGRADD